MTTQRSAKDQALKGIIFMTMGLFLFAGLDALAKFLTSDYHPVQVAWVRLGGLAIGAFVIILLKGRSVFETPKRHLQIARGFAAAGSAIFFIIAITYVPLADAFAVTFVAPFIVTIMGAVFLKEKVGIRRWSAIIIGFIGMLIVVRPGMGVLHPAVFLVFIAASCFAVRQILSRALASSDDTSTTIVYTALTSFILLSIPLPLVWQIPDNNLHLGLFISVALGAMVGEILVIRALEMAQAVALAPVHYTLLLWGTFYGYLIFGDLPDIWTWVGALIILASGLYTIHREHQRSKIMANDQMSSTDRDAGNR